MKKKRSYAGKKRKTFFDGPQSVTPEQFTDIMKKAEKYAAVEGRKISGVK